MGVFQKRDWVKDIKLPVTLQSLGAVNYFTIACNIKFTKR